jgi:hypothetical protein
MSGDTEEKIVQEILKLAIFSCLLKKISDWGKTGKLDEMAGKTVEVPIDVPAAFLEATEDLVAEQLITEKEVQVVCSRALDEHCKRFQLKKPKSFFYPGIKVRKNTKPIDILKTFITTAIRHEVLGERQIIKSHTEFTNSLDMIGALIMQLNKERGQSETGNQTLH